MLVKPTDERKVASVSQAVWIYGKGRRGAQHVVTHWGGRSVASGLAFPCVMSSSWLGRVMSGPSHGSVVNSRVQTESEQQTHD